MGTFLHSLHVSVNVCGCVRAYMCVSMSRPQKVIFTICLGFGRDRGQLGITVWTTRILMNSADDQTTTHTLQEKKGVIGDLIKCQGYCHHAVNTES